MGELEARIDTMLTEWLAGIQHLAEQSRGADGAKVCCVCGGRAEVCVATGYGGVFACRACDAETRPT